jgi:hypothetical protein
VATSGATIAAAMAARARREVREYFDSRNAFDAAHAVPYDPPTRLHRRQFDFLIGRGIARETGDGRYWIDLAMLRLEDERRKAALKLVLKIIAIVFALTIAGAAIVTALH